ncbi:MAG: hypothetical protein Edafosvirus34_9 [Edafosvirus sp.]|uniref:Uncharacterized protein n=1 Tax=Edafosvirus sp. TaxID=2487765 RepID=A0A3G4ZZL4_9VIRU|nr:MAG: hypothetical protein Edafosvirus34_9 [Edafosvirus sp.]
MATCTFLRFNKQTKALVACASLVLPEKLVKSLDNIHSISISLTPPTETKIFIPVPAPIIPPAVIFHQLPRDDHPVETKDTKSPVVPPVKTDTKEQLLNADVYCSDDELPAMKRKVYKAIQKASRYLKYPPASHYYIEKVHQNFNDAFFKINPFHRRKNMKLPNSDMDIDKLITAIKTYLSMQGIEFNIEVTKIRATFLIKIDNWNNYSDPNYGAKKEVIKQLGDFFDIKKIDCECSSRFFFTKEGCVAICTEGGAIWDSVKLSEMMATGKYNAKKCEYCRRIEYDCTVCGGGHYRYHNGKVLLCENAKCMKTLGFLHFEPGAVWKRSEAYGYCEC